MVPGWYGPIGKPSTATFDGGSPTDADSPLQAGIGYSIALLIQFWEHTNVKVNIGPLKYLIICPAYHRVHHSATRNCRMNLGTTFTIWDRLFGTYVDPATVPEDVPLGLGEPIHKNKIPRMLLGV